MKNLLIYFNPQKEFEPEYGELTKIQIDNSLDLGWKKEDIVLSTNFPYEYKGIKAIVVGPGDYEVFDSNKSSKIPVINWLFTNGFIEDELYWFHDHDAFQLIPFEINLETDAAFTLFRQPKIWNAGSFFFKKSAEDIFTDIWYYMNKRKTNEQDALTHMWDNNINNINNRYKLMDIAYNMGIYNIRHNLKGAQLPIKVAHFHPHKKHHLNLFRDMLPTKLMEIFNKYGIQ